MRFKVGDDVKIVARKWGHSHDIGDVVTITSVNNEDEDYKVNDYWFVRDDEIEIVEEPAE